MRPATHPIPPSESAIRSFGNRTGTFEYSQSTAAYMPYAKNSTATVSGGASGAVIGELPDEPTCKHTTVSVSSHAAKNGSQYPVCSDGNPSFSGASLNVTARK